MEYLHTLEYCLALKKNKGNPVIFDNMDKSERHYGKQNKPDKDRRINTSWYHVYVESKQTKNVKHIETE